MPDDTTLQGREPEPGPAGERARAQRDESSHPTVVGLGASAGGLDALRTFFQAVPEDSGLAYVVVVHLSSEHESHLAELLQPKAHVPVQQVTETTQLEPNHVYVIPPNANLSAVDTHLRLTELEESRAQRAPIDHFFRTLASTHDGHAIGVVLSGTGSDGALGIREIKAKGGLAVAQDPRDAEYDGMPQSAIATGLVDLVLPLAEIPGAVLRFARAEPRVPEPEAADAATEHRHTLQRIFAQIRARTGRDFSRYKRATVLRRIARRMRITQTEELEDYLALLRRRTEEVVALADDMLITVTSFFRDPEVFERLEKDVIPSLFEGKGPSDDIRIWTVGCATGEEAYSLTMLLMEEAARHDEPPRIQVFASDLHETSLAAARDGSYPGDIDTDVTSERLRRFFHRENGGYRIRKEVREQVVFAPHNLLGDPPFSRLDLVSCRNLLIYLQRDIQQEVVDLFHYALRPGGWLLLGTAETIEANDLFRLEDKPTCLYRKRNVSPPDPRLPVFPLARPSLTQIDRRPKARATEPLPYGALHHQMLDLFGPASLLIDDEEKVVHLSQRAGRYLIHPGGELTASVFRLVREELRAELRSALHAARGGGAFRTEPVQVRLSGDGALVSMDVRTAVDSERGEGFALVLFEEVPIGGERGASMPSEEEAAADGAPPHRLEAELEATRQRLQAIVEEYETSQEEMRASNEELQSTNEELRSTMEELETSKEEFQSMNEELRTVNQENRHKVEELAQLSNDLQNLLAATDIATLFLDREMRILRFTPRLGTLFNVRGTDRGRPLADLTHRLGYDDLGADAQEVLATLVPIEREIEDDERRVYLARTRPYRSTDDRIEGVVMTFVDITELKRAEEALRASERQYRALFESIDQGFCVIEVLFDDENRAVDARWLETNPAFERHTGLEQPVGQRARELVPDQKPSWIERYGRIALTGEPERFVDHSPAVDRWFEIEAFRVGEPQERRVAILVRDITSRVRSEEELRLANERLAEQADARARQVGEQEERFRRLVESASQITWTAHADGNVSADSGSWQRFTGQPPGDVARGRWLRMVHPDDRRELVDGWSEAVDSGTTFDGEARIFHAASGAYRWISTRAVSLPSESGGIRGWFGMGIDIDELKRSEERIRYMAGKLTAAERHERHRIAQLLHDDLQQVLYSIQMKLALARSTQEAGHDPGRLLERVDWSLRMLEQAIGTTRHLTVDLSPPLLEGEGLVAALRWLTTPMRDLHNLDVEVKGDPALHVESEDMANLVFQVVRELLFNVAKHAKTDHAVVEVDRARGRIRVTVRDHGAGFDVEALDLTHDDAATFGLLSARERLRLGGGDLKIESERGRGTVVTVYAPASSDS